MLDAQYSFPSHFVPIWRNKTGDPGRLNYLLTVAKGDLHPRSEPKPSRLLTTVSVSAPCSYRAHSPSKRWGPAWMSIAQSSRPSAFWPSAKSHKHPTSELTGGKVLKNEGNGMLSINTSKLLFLSLKNSLVIVFTAVNHKNESPQIFKRNSPSKYVNFVPWIHLLWDHMMPASTAFYLNVTFFHSALIPHLKNRFYQSFIGAKHNCSVHWNIKYRPRVLESN